MRTHYDFEVANIFVMAGNQEIFVSGTAFRNQLSYKSEILLNSTQLNQIINQLQSLNPEDSISELFELSSGENGETIYFLNADLLKSNLVNLSKLFQYNELKQLRA